MPGVVCHNPDVAAGNRERVTGMADLDRDLYEILGVVPSATSAEVTSAYRRRVRDLHPDSGEGAPEDPTGLSDVLAAFYVLRNPERRAAYDAHRNCGPHGQPSAGAVRIPVRHIAAETPGPTSAWLRAGPVRFDPAPSLGSRPFPSAAARLTTSSDLPEAARSGSGWPPSRCGINLIPSRNGDDASTDGRRAGSAAGARRG